MDNAKSQVAAVFGDQYKKMFEENKIAIPSNFRPGKHNPADDATYFLNWVQYAYATYCGNYLLVAPGGYMPSVSSVSLEELRLYGRGQQPVEKYRNQIDVSNIKGENQQRIGLVNISYRRTPIYQKIREIIIDRLMSVEHEPNVVAIDKPALTKKKMAYMRDMLAADPRMKNALQAIGKTPTGVSPDVMQMTQTDVEILNQMGGYKTVAEMAMQEASLACLQLSNYDPEIRRQLVEDWVDAAHAATHVRYDKYSGQQVIEYLDLRGLVFPRSEYDDCRDVQFGGFLKNRTIAWLRQNTELTEENLFEIATKYKNNNGNATFTMDSSNFGMFGRGNYTSRFSGQYPYDQFSVQIMTLYFIGNEVERYVMGHRPEGNVIFSKVAPESVLNRSDERRGKMLYDNPVQYVYKVDWVVGTNYIFNYGVNDIVTRDGSPGAMRAKIPIAVYRCNRGSITEACIGAIDDLQLAIYRRRHALTTMPAPPNVSIDVSIMQDSLQLGALNLTPMDAMEIYQAIGVYYYASKSEFSGPNEYASSRSPINPMPDTITPYLVALGGEIANSIQLIREISGVNEFVDGTGNAKDVLNKVAAGFETASNRSISALYTAQTSHFKSLVSIIVKGYQCMLSYGKIDITYLPVGAEVVRTIEMYPEFSMHDFDVAIIPGIDGTSRQMLFQALANNRDSQKIDEATYFNVLSLIMQGAVRRAQFVLARSVAAMEARKQQHDLDIIKQQSAAQAEQAIQTEKARQETIQLEGQIKSDQIVLQGEQTRETERLKAQLTMGASVIQQTIPAAETTI